MSRYGPYISLCILGGLIILMLYQGAQNRAAEQAMVGASAETFRLPVLGTTNVAGPQDFDGKVVLLDFWAMYCEPCREAMPDLQRLQERYGSDDFALLSINVDPSRPGVDRPGMVAQYVQSNGFTFPVLLDYGPASNAYNVTSIPHQVLIDRTGAVRFVHMRAMSFGTLADEIESLLGEQG